MLPNEFLATENFFRGIHADQFDNERVYSSAFKDSQGVSVDRSWNRPEHECISWLVENRNPAGIAKISHAKLLEHEVLPVYKYLPENRYHSELHDVDKVTLRDSKAKRLSRDSERIII